MTARKVCFWMALRPRLQPNPVMLGLLAGLRADGFAVDVRFALEPPVIESAALVPSHDLYILKSRAELWVQCAEVLKSRGGRFLQPLSSRNLLMSKLRLCGRLQAAGLPTPRTWVAADRAVLSALFKEHGPLLLKPDRGERGQGVVRLDSVAAIAALGDFDAPMVVQPYLPHEPEDIKAYVIDHEVFTFRKAFGPQSYLQRGTPYTPDDALRALVLTCGRVCGLSLYGVDLIETPTGPVIVDVNWFPSYRAVPQADARLAAFIAHRVVSEELAAS